MLVEILLLAILCTQLWSIKRCEIHCARNERWLKYMVASHTLAIVQGNADGQLGDANYDILRKLLDDVGGDK